MSLAHHWRLEPSFIFLNHGSFGACPGVVLDEQSRLRARLEAEPVRFFLRELPSMLADARAALAAFVGCAADDLAFVSNATSGVNAVVRSLSFAAGDEIVTTDHAYAACKNALDYVAGRSGARVVVARVPFPGVTEDAVVAAVLGAVTPRTRLVLLDHVTSPTGVVFPVQRLCAALAGVDVLVDGAHAPGMLPLDIAALGAAYYTGNCHKWMCAPKGAAFLWVRRDRQAQIHPLTISHGFAHGGFREEFDWVGTMDPTPWLCVPAAIRAMAELGGGWDEIRGRNRALALRGRAILCDALGVAPPAPESMIGSLAAVPLAMSAGPGKPPVDDAHFQPTALQDALHADGFEVPIIPWSPRLVRIAAQLYNDEGQIARLAEALRRRLTAGQ